MVPWRHYDVRSAVIVIVAVSGPVIWRADADAYAARSRIEADLRHCGGCCREECRGRDNAECDFSHKSLLLLLKEINAEAWCVVPQKLLSSVEQTNMKI